MQLEPVAESLGPVRVPPHELALGVVERPLMDRRAGELVQVGGGPDVVRVEVRDENGSDTPSCTLELGAPGVLRVGVPTPVSTTIQPSSPGSR